MSGGIFRKLCMPSQCLCLHTFVILLEEKGKSSSETQTLVGNHHNQIINFKINGLKIGFGSCSKQPFFVAASVLPSATQSRSNGHALSPFTLSMTSDAIPYLTGEKLDSKDALQNSSRHRNTDSHMEARRAHLGTFNTHTCATHAQPLEFIYCQHLSPSVQHCLCSQLL